MPLPPLTPPGLCEGQPFWLAGGIRGSAIAVSFTGIDSKRSTDGQLTVLDANPSPMFLGIERRTRQPITDRLATRLVSSHG